MKISVSKKNESDLEYLTFQEATTKDVNKMIAILKASHPQDFHTRIVDFGDGQIAHEVIGQDKEGAVYLVIVDGKIKEQHRFYGSVTLSGKDASDIEKKLLLLKEHIVK
ncbi:MAG: hypothetical protein H6502_05455 [Candidatus Woesearchaeota archaeon]|nr:MAG: hypothetical protein H6502_05455 [Candidatus Woesearchaeota archaeon]